MSKRRSGSRSRGRSRSGGGRTDGGSSRSSNPRRRTSSSSWRENVASSLKEFHLLVAAAQELRELTEYFGCDAKLAWNI